ncbi:MAG: hypothetical protein WC436_05220 [Candidatus Babeliales bacterium]
MEFAKLKNKRFLLSLFIFMITIILLGLPFINWGFLHDDFGVVWSSKIDSLKNLIKFFYNSGMTVTVQPSNYIEPEQSFFVVYYRPFVYIFNALQILLFNFSAYGFLLVTILLHAINAVILFNLFYPFTSTLFAFWGAMFFAFHVSLSSWLGWVAGQAHIFNFLLILLVIVFLKKYLENRNKINYIFALILFLISLFTRETAIIMPLWLMYATYLYENYLQINTKNFFQSIFKYIKFTLPFWLFTVFYFVVRYILYPIKCAGPSQIEINPLKFLINLKYRFFDLVTFLSDIFGLSFLPAGHQILKGSLIIIFFTCFLWSFKNNTKKKYILFFVFSMILFMWPAVLRYYSSRYLYKALPFCALTVMFLVNFYKVKTKSGKLNYIKFSLIFFYSFLIMSICSLFFAMKKREIFLHKLNTAFIELAQETKIQNRPICFVGLPWGTFITGSAQGMWINGVKQPVYYDRRSWGFSVRDIFENLLNIEKILQKNKIVGFSLKTSDPDKLWITSGGQEEFAMGQQIINEQKNGRVTDTSFIFDKKYLDQNMIFVTWDYEKLKFKILN